MFPNRFFAPTFFAGRMFQPIDSSHGSIDGITEITDITRIS